MLWLPQAPHVTCKFWGIMSAGLGNASTVLCKTQTAVCADNLKSVCISHYSFMQCSSNLLLISYQGQCAGYFALQEIMYPHLKCPRIWHHLTLDLALVLFLPLPG